MITQRKDNVRIQRQFTSLPILQCIYMLLGVGIVVKILLTRFCFAHKCIL